jgi:beta-glucanase (GH16 family)
MDIVSTLKRVTLATLTCSTLLAFTAHRAAAAPPTGSGWVEIFKDDFDAATLNTAQWGTCSGNVLGKGCAGGGGEIGIKLPDGVVQDAGQLALPRGQRDVTDAYGVVHNYTSGLVTARNKFAFTYGYVEARINVPQGRGFWSGVYLLPVDPRYPGPEIDLIEVLGNDTSLGYMTQHFASPSGQDATLQGDARGIDFAAGMHVVAVDWQPGLIVWYVDGLERFRSTQNVPAEPMYPLLELSIGTTWNGNDRPDASATFPNTLDVESITIWQRGDTGFWRRGPAFLRNTQQDELESFDGVHARSDNLRLISAAPLDYLGDVSRATRTNNSPAFMTWHFPNMGQADARAFFTPGEPILPFVFSTSPDNITFTPAIAQPFGFTAARPWIDYALRDLPTGTNFLKVGFPSGLPNAASAELASVSFEPSFDVIDDMSALTRTIAASARAIARTDAAAFGGDPARLARTDANGSVTWRHDGLTQAQFVAWFPPGQASTSFSFETARDGVAFTPISATITHHGAAAGQWQRVDYGFNAPPCTLAVRLTFPPGAVSPQLGSAAFLAAAPGKTDDFYWFGSADDVSTGVRFLSDAPANFGGDVSRFARLGTTAEHVDWRLPNVREVSALVFHNSQQPVLAPRFFASADAATFVELTATQTLTTGTWTQARYTAAVPRCMDVVRVEIPAGGSDGAVTQLARFSYRAAVPALGRRVYLPVMGAA